MSARMRELIPYFWEIGIIDEQNKGNFIAFAEVLFNSIQETNDTFVRLVSFLRDRMAYTGQKLSLNTMLNDKFDPINRRLELVCLGLNFIGGIDIYNNDETDPTPLILVNNQESNPTPVTIWTNAEIFNDESIEGKSFIVYVPNENPNSDELIRGILNLYVIAPQNYLIKRYI